VSGKNVLIVDFSFCRQVLEEMNIKAKSLFVIDHHTTAQEELKGLGYCQFDKDRSGAVMTWNYLHGKVPQLILFVEDRDLWKWSLDNSKEVSAALASYPMDFETWDAFIEDDNCIKRLTMEGRAILRYQNLEVSRKISAWRRSPRFIEIGGYKVPVMNCTSLISEICGELSWGHPVAATYMDVNEKRIYSLRRREGDVDCGLVDSQYGGGGHTGAAGYSVDL
jgi:oligoribonuclease NrnB/cAMP/cGMP phosphodiesterase (DHH superfamily)